MATLGEVLRNARNEQHLTMKDVYDHTGITDSRLSRMENGKCFPDPDSLRKLSLLYKQNTVEMLLLSGHITSEDLSAYSKVFPNVELLDSNEKDMLKDLIQYFIFKKRGSL